MKPSKYLLKLFHNTFLEIRASSLVFYGKIYKAIWRNYSGCTPASLGSIADVCACISFSATGQIVILHKQGCFPCITLGNGFTRSFFAMCLFPMKENQS